MTAKGKAETVRVMGVKWTWDYTERRWISTTPVGKWSLWWDGARWSLQSPTGAIYTMVKQHRYEAMVGAGHKIAVIERWLKRQVSL